MVVHPKTTKRTEVRAPGPVFDMAHLGLCTVVHTLQLRAAVIKNRCSTTLHHVVSHCIGSFHLLIIDHRCDSVFRICLFWLQVAFLGIMCGFHALSPPPFSHPSPFPFLGVNLFLWFFLQFFGSLASSLFMQSEPLDDAPQPSVADALETELQAPLLTSVRFKVKRWAGKDHRRPTSVSSSASAFVPPTPKSPSLPGPPRVDRWSHGFLDHNYRSHLTPLVLGSDYGAPPVFHQQRSFEVHSVGGLALAPRGLGIHRPGMSHLVSLPSRCPAPPLISQHSALSSKLVGDSSAPVSGIHPSSGPVQKMSELHDQLKAQHFHSWLALLAEAGSSSRLFRDTAESPLGDEHRIKAIAHYAPSMMAAYLRMWAQWYEFATCHQASPYCPSVVLVADFLHVHSSSSTQGLAVNHLKAMMWVAKHAGLPELLVTLQLPLSKAYGS